MEVTKHTFNEELDNILSAIEESSFLAIDGEFTGLDVSDSGHAAPFDTPSERYTKIRNECSDFLLIQFGLCAFKVDEEKQKYYAKPYNFYLFPKPFGRRGPDRRFLCQSSSIDFLISQGFDFNKLFKEVPFMLPCLCHLELDNSYKRPWLEITRRDFQLICPGHKTYHIKYETKGILI